MQNIALSKTSDTFKLKNDMNKNSLPKIKTERLLLRELKQSDWEDVSYLRSDKDVNKFVKRPSAETKEKALEFISKISNGIKKKSFYYWSISEKSNTKMIGSVCLWNFSKNKKTAEIGYDLNPKFQQKGIMDEALKRVLEFGFNNLKLDVIEAFTHKENVSSKKLLERNKFKLIQGRKDGDNKDNIIYEIKNARTYA